MIAGSENPFLYWEHSCRVVLDTEFLSPGLNSLTGTGRTSHKASELCLLFPPQNKPPVIGRPPSLASALKPGLLPANSVTFDEFLNSAAAQSVKWSKSDKSLRGPGSLRNHAWLLSPARPVQWQWVSCLWGWPSLSMKPETGLLSYYRCTTFADWLGAHIWLSCLLTDWPHQPGPWRTGVKEAHRSHRTNTSALPSSFLLLASFIVAGLC